MAGDADGGSAEPLWRAAAGGGVAEGGGTVAGGGLAGLLRRAAGGGRERGLLYVDEGGAVTVQSYAGLHELACRMLAGLDGLGLRPGAEVVLVLERAPDVVPVFWACVLGGLTPCPMAPPQGDPGRWAARLGHVGRLLGDPPIVTGRKLLTALPSLPGRTVALVEDLRDTSPGRSTTPGEPYAAHHGADGVHEPVPDDVAVLMLTSGSSGDSKAVPLTHANLLSSLAAKAERLACHPGDVMMNWIAFDHIAAIEAHLLPLSMAASQVQVEPPYVLGDPLRFLRLAAQHGVTLTFAPNFLFGEINKALPPPGDPELDLSALRHILSGGEAVVCDTARRFLRALAPYGLRPGAIVPAFGMTETCAGSTMNLAFPEADEGREFASLGPPIPGFGVRIADGDDAPLPAEVEGELQVSGPMVFGGYAGDPEASAAAFTGDGWFRTGDRGRLSDGRLILTGRSKDSIIVNGVNHPCQEVEAALGALPEVRDTCVAAFPVRRPGDDTERPAVVFTPSVPLSDEEGVRRALVAVRDKVARLWGVRPAVILPLPAPELPRTALGKIQRALLRRRLDEGEFAERQRRAAELTGRLRGAHLPPRDGAERAVAGAYADLFGLRPAEVGATANFLELGGTSLDVLRLKQRLRRDFPGRDLPPTAILRAPTVRALAALLDGEPGQNTPYDPIVPLQQTGEGTPLFCVHPGVGEVLVFVNLAGYFTGERPFHALRARGFGPGEPHFGSFEEMVSCYVDAIRLRQPVGPYAIAGYSYGGAVAFEIAKALEGLGERVDFVGIFNLPPHIRQRMNELDFTEGALHLALFLDLLAPAEAGALQPALRDLPAPRQIDRIMAAASKRRLAELDLGRDQFAAWVDLAQSLVRAGRSYEPSGTVASVSVFYAIPLRGTKQDWLDHDLRKWDDFTRGENRYLEVPGEHYTLMNAHHVDAFQRVLRAELDRCLRGR
ncbi:non-ribosomal peptide synthetase [Nonomuraea rubra]|uniref:Acyl-CoA synthetase (AMP-forming)/AMP-acid ligase II/thioesterase domain-containing protein n=3 Tax=Nonomuraea rubra TaxID=46180 RepID=A0A7X0NXH1_9ACTN|nr:non-ribosomal peptide synthetase [Nonomuraea rubra]MBB6551438.1 acyl-CoA synthetase (AMP-forming)/AMP-acid ligase II/thioesterase domain-containing protein [Nonomuraea rubra]